MMTESVGLVDSQGRTWRVMEREDGSISVYYTRLGVIAHFVVFDTLDDLQIEFTRLRIANTALIDVCKEAERYIGGIPDDRIDGRDADPILDKLDWAITQAEGWAAEQTKATEALRAAAADLIAYRDASGPLNFQLEKADDYLERLCAALAKTT